MADNLIFPIKFDLEKGVIEAGKDADKYLRQLENTLRQKPIKLDVAIDGAAPGSIDAISKRMAALSTEFNKLAEAQRVYNRASGEFTPEAQKIIKEYAELTAATQTYAQSLSQITAAAKRQTQEQMKAQEQEIKRYEEYWKRKEAENAKQAQQEVANAERARKTQQQRISQEQAADAKRYQEWLRQKNQEAVETERVERQKQQSRERTIAQQNREFAAQRQAEQQRQQAISASLRTEYQRIEAKKQAEAASRRELQILNQQYAAEERRQRLAASQASIAKRQQVIKTLRAEENTIVNITAKLQHWQQVMNSSAMDGRQFKRAAEEVQRLSQKLSEAQARISQLTSTTSNASARQSAAVRQVSQEFSKQDSYLTNLLKKTAALWSIHQVSSFLTNVREVTAQFELQRVSLGAIIQDQNKANQFFSEIKSFALKSPVSILDLTKYTKQLAAYKVGFDGLKTDTKELFEWTKRLTDVSVGLGVSMDRVVLAFGQVRATGYLRASEVRQFTEMGVPIVEELAAKLSKLNGEAITAAQVMDMISKRGISFEMVKEVFDDMTAAGGIFYNMQEKQGNTLYGLWAKLGDAASVMYEQIGNTGFVNSTMKSTIQLLTDLMKNWKLVGREITVVAAGYGVYRLATALSVKDTVAAAKADSALLAAKKQLRAAKIAEITATNNLNAAHTRGNSIRKFGVQLSIAEAQASIKAAQNYRKAAMSTNVWTAAKYRLIGAVNSLKAAFMGNWITIVLTALTAIGMAMYSAYEKAHKLKNALSDIEAEGVILANQSAGKFEQLADAAVNAATGSKQQRDALEELKRTYRDIIPEEQLTLENLQKLKKDGYEPLISSIREYIAVQQRQKGLSAISEEYGARINEASKVAMDSLVKSLGIDRGVAAQIVGEMQREIQENLEKGVVDFRTTGQKLQAAAKKLGIDVSNELARSLTTAKWHDNWYDLLGLGEATNEFDALTQAIVEQNEEIENWTNTTKGTAGATGEWLQKLEKAKKELAETTYVMRDKQGNKFSVDEDTFLHQQMQANAAMKKAAQLIGDELKTELGQEAEKLKPQWLHLVDSVDSNDLMDITKVNFDAVINAVKDESPILAERLKDVQKEWGNVIPTDSKVQLAREKGYQIVKDAQGNIDKMSRFLMQSGEDWKTYVTRIKDEMESEKQKLKELRKEREKTAQWGLLARLMNPLADVKVNESEKKLEQLTTLFNTFKEFYDPDEKKKKGGSKSDPRLQILQEMVSTLKQVNKEYDDLAKKEGATKALADTQKIYADTFKNMQQLAGKYKFTLPNFGVPQDADSLTKYLNAIRGAMKKLPKSDKAVLALQVEIDKLNIDAQQKRIETELKELADRISRTKTAKEFYEKILSQTGDIKLATNLSVALYGETGEDLFYNTVKQIQEIFRSNDANIDLKINADLSDVIDFKNERINYGELARIYEKYQNQIVEANRTTAQNIIKEGQKTTAAQILNWEKELAKAKSYEEQRTDIINKAAEERAKIIKEVRDPKEQEKLLGLSREKESQDLAKVNFEEFTKSEDYVRIFENLDNVATSSLKHLREELQKVIDTNQNLSPENMKTLVKAMEDIDQQIGERNPFETLVSSAREYVDSIKNIKQAKRELAAAEAEYKTQEPQLIADIETAKAEKETSDTDVVEAQQQLLDIQNQMAVLRAQEIVDETALAELKEREIAAENNLVSAKLRQNQAETNVTKAVQNQFNAQNKVNNAQKKLNKNTDNAKKSQNNFLKSINNTKEKVGAVQSAMEALSPILGDLTKEGTDFGDAWLAVVQAMETFQTLMTVVTILQEAFNIATESNPWMAIAAAVLAVVAALSSYISNQKVAEANKEIEKQEKLLNQLEYAYGRLEKAAEKVFGADYINNFNQRQKTLQAQAIAYQKQYQAELSKGKKADEEKLKEFQEKYRDTMDEIADMQGQVAERMLGTDLTSAARDFAQAWLDAYKEFGNTADAMSEKFHEMIENMVVESLLAKAMQRALEPTFKMIDEMNEGDFYSEDFWRKVMETADKGSKDANAAGAVIMEWAKKWGYDGREKAEGFSGIAKSVAGATSEEINTAAAIGNTLMYYVSPIPRIDENLARVVAIMEGRGASAIPQTTSAGWTDWQLQAMDNYNAIARNTADTVVECRRAAEACEKITRLIKTKGATSGFNVFLNS